MIASRRIPDKPKTRGNQLMIAKVEAFARQAHLRAALDPLFDTPTEEQQQQSRSAAQLKRERKQQARLRREAK